MKLTGKSVLITGASRGIGRAIAAALAASGCKLLLTAREPDEIGQVAGHLASQGATVSSFTADLLEEEQRRSLLVWLAEHEPLDILVNNAGSGHFDSFAASDWNDVERVFRLDAYVPTYLIHALLPSLLERPDAAIINVSSASARIPYPGLAVYAASKAYVSSLSQTLATELAGTSVRVVCVHPGFTQTHFFESAGMDMHRVPRWSITSAEKVARRILRMLKSSEPCGYSDLATRLGLALAAAIPHRIRPRVFRRLFWDLPPANKERRNA